MIAPSYSIYTAYLWGRVCTCSMWFVCICSSVIYRTSVVEAWEGWGVEINALTRAQRKRRHESQQTTASITANTSSISSQRGYTRVFVQTAESPLGLRDCWQPSRCVIWVSLSVYVYIQTEKSELSRRKNTPYQQRTRLFVDSLSHYEFFIVIEVNKASVLCFHIFSCQKELFLILYRNNLS